MVLGIEAQRLPVLGFGAGKISDELQRCAEVVAIRRLAAVACDGAAEGLDGFGMRAGACHHDANCVERQRGGRLERQRSRGGFERFAWPV